MLDDKDERPTRMTGSGSLPSAGWLSIPTEDPEQALRFCRSLAELVAGPEKLALENLADSQSQAAGDSAVKTVRDAPMLSVVLPVFEEEENLPELYARLVRVLESQAVDFELVFVDDGSRDQSSIFLQSLAAKDERVVLVELARNFGHQIAISAGMDFALGKGVVIMDSDLQDPPEFLPELIAKWQSGYDVVYAIRQKREASWSRRAAYKLFYRLLKGVANIDIPLDTGDFCIMDRKVVDVLVGMPERNRFMRGIRSWIGLKQIGLPYQRPARVAGAPKYTFSRLLFLALDGLVSFSYMPLRLISVVGFTTSLVSIVLAGIYAVLRLTRGLSPPGFATLVVAIFFLAGVQLITIGVIGEYVGRIFEEVKRRPLYITRSVTGDRVPAAVKA